MEIEKAYFTVPEILDRWSVSEVDLIYLAENDKLRLSVRVFGAPLEFGDFEETDNAQCFRVPRERCRYSGLLDLHAQDAFQLFRCGEGHLSDFRTPRAPYAILQDGAEPIFVMIGDLLLRREERDRFEAETGFAGAEAGLDVPDFDASGNYQDIRCNGRNFHLGPIQSQVVRVLHEAAQDGHPWQSGKAILMAAGSRSLRMADVFKSQKHWRELINSNRRGAYRLNCH